MSLLKIVLCGIFCFCSNFCYAAESDMLSDYNVVGDRIYIHPEQLLINHDGIFIFIDGDKVLVRQLNCDENGIFCFIEDVDKITDKCPNGHKMWCGRCGGCVVRYCKFRCICVEWE